MINTLSVITYNVIRIAVKSPPGKFIREIWWENILNNFLLTLNLLVTQYISKICLFYFITFKIKIK